MKTLSLDLRERILGSYDREEGTREQIAARFCVSVGMVKKLLQQRRKTGDIAPRHGNSGRKPMIQDFHRRRMKELLAKKPDLTLHELRSAMKLECTLPAIHYVLKKLGLTYKKRRSMPVSKAVRMSPGPAERGNGGRGASIQPD